MGYWVKGKESLEAWGDVCLSSAVKTDAQEVREILACPLDLGLSGHVSPSATQGNCKQDQNAHNQW